MRLDFRSIAIGKPGGARLMLPFDRVESFMAALRLAGTMELVRQLVDDEVQALGFDRYAYILMRPPKGLRERLYFGTYPGDWSKHYAQRDLRLHDPIWDQPFDTVQPFLWQDVQLRETDQAADKLVFGPSADAGLRSGAGIPLHGPSGAVAALQVAGDSQPATFRVLFEEQRPVLQLVALNTHARVIELLPWAAANGDVALSPRQKDVLLWTIRGKTNWEIGELLEISEDTVRQHMIKICRLLGASNRAQAAVIAVTKGLVMP